MEMSMDELGNRLHNERSIIDAMRADAARMEQAAKELNRKADERERLMELSRLELR
jgi:hypothetical protein